MSATDRNKFLYTVKSHESRITRDLITYKYTSFVLSEDLLLASAILELNEIVSFDDLKASAKRYTSEAANERDITILAAAVRIADRIALAAYGPHSEEDGDFVDCEYAFTDDNRLYVEYNVPVLHDLYKSSSKETYILET
jgi:hypothetical protein